MEDLKVGDFIHAKYKYGCVCGVIKKINKNIVVINEHRQWYTTYTPSDSDLNVTKKRIFEVIKKENFKPIK